MFQPSRWDHGYTSQRESSSPRRVLALYAISDTTAMRLFEGWRVRERTKRKKKTKRLHSLIVRSTFACSLSQNQRTSSEVLFCSADNYLLGFRLCWVQARRYQRGKKSQVGWYFKFWSSSPVYLMLFTFQSPKTATPGTLSGCIVAHRGTDPVRGAYLILPRTRTALDSF